MEQFIKTFHNYDDDTVNADIERRSNDGWIVRQFEYSSQIVTGKVKSCLIILYERSGK